MEREPYVDEQLERERYWIFAKQLAQDAGQILMDHYGQMQKLEYKLKTNFKTEVDDKVDAFCREQIKKNFPTHGIESEEADALENESEYTWVVDPLDGTLPYTYGINDHFSVCVSLVKGKEPIVGVIYAPLRNEFYYAEAGQPAVLNEEPIQVAKVDNLNQAMVGIDYGKLNRGAHLPYLEKMLAADGIAYPYSHACASVGLGLVASGRLHAYMALKLEPWDMAAAVAIIRAAGGKVTTIDGKEWELGDESILAAHPALHEKLLEYLKG